MKVHGAKRDQSVFFVQVEMGCRDGRHENIYPLYWVPATADQARAALLKAQLEGVDAWAARTGERQWEATFTRAVEIIDDEDVMTWLSERAEQDDLLGTQKSACGRYGY